MRKECFGEFDSADTLKATGTEKTTYIPPNNFVKSGSWKDTKGNIAMSSIEENAVEINENQHLETVLRIKEHE